MRLPITKKQAEDIYSQHFLALYKLALFMTQSKPLAEDMVSETFLIAFEKYHQYDKTKPIKPWLSKILVNCVRQNARKFKRWFLTDSVPETADQNNFVESIFSGAQDQLLWELVSQLKPKSREIVVLHYYESLTLPEIASLLEIPVGTCKSRLNAALTQLRRSNPNHLAILEY